MMRITDEDTDELPLDTRARTRTKVDLFRRKINYDKAASIIAEMASYSDLLFKQHIGEKDGIRKVDRWEDFELFNELFAEHDSNAPSFIHNEPERKDDSSATNEVPAALPVARRLNHKTTSA